MTESPTLSLIDTHAHLDDDQFAGDIEAVLARARAAGVGCVINIGYRPLRWQSTLALAERHAMISFTLGMHPHHADEWSDDTRRHLIALLDLGGAVAVGEIGIDRYRDGPALALQQTVFEQQLVLAAERKLPAVIHQRAAEAEVIEVLRQAPVGPTCVLHSFEGSMALANLARERGDYVGVGGLMTRPSAAGVREILQTIPLERMLLETDSPYLVPRGAQGRRNEPANIPIIAARLAELLETSVSEVEHQTMVNACTVFGLPATGAAAR